MHMSVHMSIQTSTHRHDASLDPRQDGVYIGHNYIGHNYIGHSYIGHNYIGHNRCASHTRPYGLPSIDGLETCYITNDALETAPAEVLDEYDIVVLAGKHEYFPADTLPKLKQYVQHGGILYNAGYELAWAVMRRDAGRAGRYTKVGGIWDLEQAHKRSGIAGVYTEAARIHPDHPLLWMGVTCATRLEEVPLGLTGQADWIIDSSGHDNAVWRNYWSAGI